jgi:hypothetical protein
MDDAMLLSCGHSVGKGGLRRVMETVHVLPCCLQFCPGKLLHHVCTCIRIGFKTGFFLEYLVDMFELCTVERPRQMQDRMVHRMYDIQGLVWQNVCITCGASVLTETMTPNYGNEFVNLWNSYHVLVSQMLLRICMGNASEYT